MENRDFEEFENDGYKIDSYTEKLTRKFRGCRFAYTVLIIRAIIYLISKVKKYPSLRGIYSKAVFWFVLTWFLYVVVDFCAQRQKMLMKCSNKSMKSLYDCYYYLFKNEKKKNKKDSYILKMSMCNIIMHDFEKGATCLNHINLDNLTRAKKFDYFIQKSIISKFLGQVEELQYSIAACEKLMLKDKESRIEQEQLKVLKFGTVDQMYDFIEENKNKRQYKGILNLLRAIKFIILSFGFFKVQKSLPQGVEYRSYVEYIGYSIILFGIALIGGFILHKIVIYKLHSRDNNKLSSLYSSLIVLIPYFIVLLLTGNYIFKSIKSEIIVNDNIILVKNVKESKSYYYDTNTLFLRKIVFEENNIQRENFIPSLDNEIYLEDNNEDLMFAEDERVMSGYEKIYSEEFEKNGDVMEFSTSAKGNIFAFIGHEKDVNIQGETYKSIKRLVYDNESNNGKCDIYVYYEDYYKEDINSETNTKILDFYAVNKESGKVIRGNKTSWEESGTEEYIKATNN